VDRLAVALLSVLILAVTGLGVVVWTADRHARDAADRQLCVERADATATIALLAPSASVDPDGRIEAMATLGERIDAC
jgi:hypothetical protein